MKGQIATCGANVRIPHICTDEQIQELAHDIGVKKPRDAAYLEADALDRIERLSNDFIHIGVALALLKRISPQGQAFCRGSGGRNTFANTYRDTIVGDDQPFDPRPWTSAAGDKPIVLFGADHYKTRLPDGGRFICWDKSCGQGPTVSFCDAEFAWTNRRNPRSIVRHFWMGAMRAADEIEGKMMKLHVIQKPVSVMSWCLDHARVGLGKWVLDPYMGSGSTGVACILTGRRFIGVEIDRKNYETACARIERAWTRIQAGENVETA
jgi:hypothetical protein